MWRLIVIQLYFLFISTLATAIPPTLSSSDAKTQEHSPARVSHVLGAKHGYRYHVKFPANQQTNILSTRYQSAVKGEDNDSSASIGSLTLAKYTNGYTNAMDSLQKANLPNSYSLPSSDISNSYMPNNNYLPSSSTGDYEEKKAKIENNEKVFEYMLPSNLQHSEYSTTNIGEEQSMKMTDLYLPPETFHISVTNKSEGYTYKRPTNQLTLLNENHNQEHSMTDPHWYPPIPTDNDDDSIEVFPPMESPTTLTNGNTANQKYKQKTKEKVSTAEFHNYLQPKTHEQRTMDFNTFNDEQYNKNIVSPSLKTEHYSSYNNPYTMSYKNDGDKPDSFNKGNFQVNPQLISKDDTNFMNGESKSALNSIINHKTEIDELSEPSLMVHFAGSVFSADGLPHPSKEMVFPVDYNFSYDLRGWPEMGHEETRADTTTRGRYWVGLPDGRFQLVEYTAGPQGFMPRVSYRSRSL